MQLFKNAKKPASTSSLKREITEKDKILDKLEAEIEELKAEIRQLSLKNQILEDKAEIVESALATSTLMNTVIAEERKTEIALKVAEREITQAARD